jgi:lysosomal acid lipase/cholesteryl ester hydrolase
MDLRSFYVSLSYSGKSQYVLQQTGASSLTYIGFSQGTTICFAALSLLPDFRRKINMFVALAASTKPKGIT